MVFTPAKGSTRVAAVVVAAAAAVVSAGVVVEAVVGEGVAVGRCGAAVDTGETHFTNKSRKGGANIAPETQQLKSEN
jgi:hypothetical protein